MSSALYCSLTHDRFLAVPHEHTVIFLRRSCQPNIASSNDQRTPWPTDRKHRCSPHTIHKFTHWKDLRSLSVDAHRGFKETALTIALTIVCDSQHVFVNFNICAKFHEYRLGPKQLSHVLYLDIVVGQRPCCRLGAKSEQKFLAVRAFDGALLPSLLVSNFSLCHDLFAGALERLSDVVGLSGSRRVIAWATFAAWARVRSHFVQQ